MSPNPLRKLPSVHELLESPALRALTQRISRSAAAETVRTVLDEVRREAQSAAAARTLPSAADLAERIARRIAAGRPSALRPVINATGALLDDRFGGAPLAEEAVVEMAAVGRDYASLEFDPDTGRQCRRTAAVDDLLRELTGAEASLVVNDNTGAMLLTMAALAAGRAVIVSRGQLIELGGGCRLPELFAAAGAVLREVGATNKTRPDDYCQAIDNSTAALLFVHPTDFTVVGAAESATLAEVVAAGRRHKLTVIDHLGCGALVNLDQFGVADQASAVESLKTGADLALLGGDKLLGGPQCGILLGRKALIDQLERHPLARAMQVDKLTLAALTATLRLYRDPPQARWKIPLLSLLTTSVDNLRNRAERIAAQATAAAAVSEAAAVPDATPLGWGETPTQELPTWCVSLSPATGGVGRFAAVLRSGSPSVVGRVKADRLLLDLRSVLPRQDMELLSALEALDRGGGNLTEPPNLV